MGLRLALGLALSALAAGCRQPSSTCDSEPGEETRLTLSASGTVDTHGRTALVTAQLTEAPDASVTVRFLATPPEQFELTPSELTFTPTDFATPQELVVRYRPGSGVGPGSVLITTDGVSSNDERFDCFQPNASVLHLPAGCGDEVLEPGEDCEREPGPAFTLDCAYGEETCVRCGVQTACKNVPGRFVARCGDGVVTPQLEFCEPDASVSCGVLTPGSLGVAACDPVACNWNLSTCLPVGTLPCRDRATCDDCEGSEVRHACFVEGDGGVVCRGANANGEAEPPAGDFVQVSEGAGFTCGVERDGSARCWGALTASWPSDVASVVAGAHHACVLLRSGAVACSGAGDAGQLDAPTTLRARALSAGRLHTCAALDDAGVQCWGDDTWGQSTPPASLGPALEVAAGPSRSCARHADGGATCWGGGLGCREPAGPWRSLVGGANGLGALRPDGGVALFAGAAQLPTSPPDRWSFLSGGRFSSGCGVRPDGSMDCFGPDFRYFVPRPGPFLKAWGNPPFACGLQPDAGLSCFSAPSWTPSVAPVLGPVTDLSFSGQPLAGCALYGVVPTCWGLLTPSRTFAQLETRKNAACGVENGIIFCWGSPRLDPPVRFFKSVALSRDGSTACGVRRDGALECFGRITVDLGDRTVSLAPPPGRHLAVQLGQYVACALREATIGDTAGELSCWGDEATGITRVPAGRFQSLTFLGDRACALSVTGESHCWGGDAPGADFHPPREPINELKWGARHACTRGSAWSCFGDDGFGVSTPADVSFRDVSIGDERVCALRPDGGARCWSRAGTATEAGLVAPAAQYEVGDSPFTCARLADGRVDCRGQTSMPMWQTLSVGGSAACGLTFDGGVACLGQLPAPWQPLAQPAVEVSVSSTHACAWLAPSGEVRCVGTPSLGFTNVMPRAFDVGAGQVCVVDDVGALRCVGALFDGGVPLGDFDAVSLSRTHGCSRELDGGALRCWPSTSSPAGRATRFDVGDGLTCTLDARDALSCKGWMVR